MDDENRNEKNNEQTKEKNRKNNAISFSRIVVVTTFSHLTGWSTTTTMCCRKNHKIVLFRSAQAVDACAQLKCYNGDKRCEMNVPCDCVRWLTRRCHIFHSSWVHCVIIGTTDFSLIFDDDEKKRKRLFAWLWTIQPSIYRQVKISSLLSFPLQNEVIIRNYFVIFKLW